MPGRIEPFRKQEHSLASSSFHATDMRPNFNVFGSRPANQISNPADNQANAPQSRHSRMAQAARGLGNTLLAGMRRVSHAAFSRPSHTPAAANNTRPAAQLSSRHGLEDITESFTALLANPETAVLNETNYRSALVATALGGSERVLNQFLSSSLAPVASEEFILNGNRTNLISLVAIHGRGEIAQRLLLEPGIDPSQNRNFTIGLAAVAGNTEVVKVLLNDSRVNPADNDNAALRSALRHDQIETVAMLLGDGRVQSHPSFAELEHDIRANPELMQSLNRVHNEALDTLFALTTAFGKTAANIERSLGYGFASEESTVGTFPFVDRTSRKEHIHAALLERLNHQ